MAGPVIWYATGGVLDPATITPTCADRRHRRVGLAVWIDDESWADRSQAGHGGSRRQIAAPVSCLGLESIRDAIWGLSWERTWDLVAEKGYKNLAAADRDPRHEEWRWMKPPRNRSLLEQSHVDERPHSQAGSGR